MASADSKRAIPATLARLLWVASKLNGKTDASFEGWCREEIGIEARIDEARDHIKALRPRSRRGRPATKSKPKREARKDAVIDWLLVDEQELELLPVLYRLPNDGMPRPELYKAVAGLPGVRQAIETKGDRELLIVGLVRSVSEADDLRERIAEHAPGQAVKMDLIERETQRPAVATWRWLAKREAEDWLADRGQAPSP
ncbi:MAG TPA: hypothetical protein VHF50_07850 [Solirubrobacterales bacterium]|nr:hypothetical protein [Solirubrobacterales bacterium]